MVTSGWETEKIKELSIGDYAGLEKLFNRTSGVPLDGKFTDVMWQQSTQNEMQHLNNEDCFARNSVQLQSTASNVIVVMKSDTGKYSTIPPSIILLYSHIQPTSSQRPATQHILWSRLTN